MLRAADWLLGLLARIAGGARQRRDRSPRPRLSSPRSGASCASRAPAVSGAWSNWARGEPALGVSTQRPHPRRSAWGAFLAARASTRCAGSSPSPSIRSASPVLLAGTLWRMIPGLPQGPDHRLHPRPPHHAVIRAHAAGMSAARRALAARPQSADARVPRAAC
ncbi:MAG: hypothetical protein MZW92_40745 [Comamonadaceae bacterium]|nr:hypothetical protein [Comamonadaceae bacterium]